MDIEWYGLIPTLTVHIAETKERKEESKEANCRFCNVLTQDQKAHLSTPDYQKRKGKCDQKAIQEETSSSLIDLTLVS